MNKRFPYLLSPQNEDECYMAEALKEAWKAFLEDEVPVGAVLVHAGRIVARGHNQVEMLRDATAHAEMLCLTAGSAVSDKGWRLNEMTLYCTLEPCTMCAGAMFLSRLGRLVWGAKDLRHGANGSWIDLFENKHPMHTVEITSGVYAELAAEMMRTFFVQKRVEKGAARDESGDQGIN